MNRAIKKDLDFLCKKTVKLEIEAFIAGTCMLQGCLEDLRIDLRHFMDYYNDPGCKGAAEIKKFYLVTILFLIAVCCSCRGRDDGGDKILPGGFAKVPAKDAEVMNAAWFAVEEKRDSEPGSDMVLERVLEAKQQVVAGINYYMVIGVIEHGGLKIAEAVVWKELSGGHKLISWKWR